MRKEAYAGADRESALAGSSGRVEQKEDADGLPGRVNSGLLVYSTSMNLKAQKSLVGNREPFLVLVNSLKLRSYLDGVYSYSAVKSIRGSYPQAIESA